MARKKTNGLLLIAVTLAGVGMMSGCNSPASIIDKATISLSQNLETVNVALEFTNAVQSNTFAGAFTIGNYGELFVDPYTSRAPFQVGFSLNTSIMNDQSYINIAPTEVLPNGVPLPVSTPLVQIKSPAPISPQVDLYGYIDVKGTSWLGTAAIFTVTDKYFPEGLSLTQILLTDNNGAAEIIGSAFGPVMNGDGTIKQPGGVALFANVKELIANGELTPEHPLTLTP